ncbi:hypothetical protein G3352_05615 [Paenibacillus sp. ALJ109b]|nr:hypothetical protein [Paenibacillus sp. ALJ109b]
MNDMVELVFILMVYSTRQGITAVLKHRLLIVELSDLFETGLTILLETTPIFWMIVALLGTMMTGTQSLLKHGETLMVLNSTSDQVTYFNK